MPTMVCRMCLRQGAGLARRPLAVRAFTTGLSFRSATAAPAARQSSSDPTKPDDGATSAEARPVLSSCPAGTVLTGLNYFKGKSDPVAKADEEYPDWLWKCLDVKTKSSDETELDAGDEFSKSKKQRRLAAKRQRQLEASLLASGNLEALAPKIPLQQQTTNLPAAEDGSVEGALFAAEKREELRKAMRKERRANIKETNYLKSM